jgi:hypothetical protein
MKTIYINKNNSKINIHTDKTLKFKDISMSNDKEMLNFNSIYLVYLISLLTLYSFL